MSDYGHLLDGLSATTAGTIVVVVIGLGLGISYIKKWLG